MLEVHGGRLLIALGRRRLFPNSGIALFFILAEKERQHCIT